MNERWRDRAVGREKNPGPEEGRERATIGEAYGGLRRTRRVGHFDRPDRATFWDTARFPLGASRSPIRARSLEWGHS